MKDWIKKWWVACALPVAWLAVFGLFAGVSIAAEAAADIPVLEPLSATGPHIAAWVEPPAGAPPTSLLAVAAADPVVAPDPGEDAGGFIAAAFAAARSKNGWLIASVLVVGLTFLLRLGVRHRTGPLSWFASDRGGVVLTALVATLGGFAHATAAGAAPALPFILEVAEVWLGAIGLYVAVKKSLAPADKSSSGGKSGG